jgi:hypothetical protein
MFLKAAAGTSERRLFFYRATVPKLQGFARSNGRPDRQFIAGRRAKPADAGAGA